MIQSPSNEWRRPIRQWWRGFRRRSERCDESHVEVYVPACAHAPGTHEHHNQFFDRLATASDEHIDSYDVTVLGKEICLCDRCRQREHHQDLLATVTTLITWEREGLRTSGFVTREIESMITDERHSVISIPELVVGIYLDDSLFGVFPCQSDEAHYSPEVFLRGLTSSGVDSGGERSPVQSDSD
jgi:hypothetical protein